MENKLNDHADIITHTDKDGLLGVKVCVSICSSGFKIWKYMNSTGPVFFDR